MQLEDIERLAVLGAGNMGHGIAEVAAMAGFEVTMRDVSEELVEAGLDDIEWSLGKLVERGELGEDEADAVLGRVTPVVDLAAAVGDADVVIEAVPERMDIKREVYAEVEEHVPDRAVLATNTSSLSITALSEATERPGRFCGMHFFNPPVRMELVEVIAGAHTEEATLALIEELAEAMGKTPVRVRKDSPGFIVNRVLTPLLNEAAWLLERDEATIETVDSTAKFDLGLPMGAFELADQVGIDVAVDVLDYLHAELGPAYEPCPVLSERVEAGDLGRKTGVGFYDYDDGGAEVPSGEGHDVVATRLVAVMANEVAKLIEADVADAEEIDRAMRLGAGFPDGPARLADDRGVASLRETLAELHDATGAARYEPAALLAEYAEAGRGFYADGGAGDDAAFEAIRAEREGRVGRIILDRPHRLNTITEGMLGEIDAALDRFEADDGIRAVLITGAGDRAFCAGADVTAFAGLDPERATELSREGQRVFGRFESSGLPVVAGIDGYCLGGGMELATACDLRVASATAEFAQPERNLGLLPGWGGTQRLPRLVGEGRARELVLTGERYDAETMYDYGFVNETVEGDLDERALELATHLADGPPIAQKLAKRALLAGRDDPDGGLEVEAEAFGELMTTEDLLEGVTAFANDREPEFEGR